MHGETVKCCYCLFC